MANTALTAQQFTALVSPISTGTITAVATTPADLLAKFKTYWPVAKGVLSTIKIITGDKVDKVIDKIIEGGDAIINAAPGTINDKIIEFCNVWHTLRGTISGIAQFIPGKAGAIIRDFIKVVDLLCCEHGVC